MDVLFRHMTYEDDKPPNFEMILDYMLPDDPKILHEFAETIAPADSLAQKGALERAEMLLENVSQSDVQTRVLLGQVMIALGDTNGGIDQLEVAINSNPNNNDARSYLIDILVGENRLNEAFEHATELHRYNEKNRQFKQKYDSIKQLIEERRK